MASPYGPAQVSAPDSVPADVLRSVLDVLAGLLDTGVGLVRFAFGFKSSIIRGSTDVLLGLALELLGLVSDLVSDTHCLLLFVVRTEEELMRPSSFLSDARSVHGSATLCREPHLLHFPQSGTPKQINRFGTLHPAMLWGEASSRDKLSPPKSREQWRSGEDITTLNSVENISVTELPMGPRPGRAEPVAAISKARAAVLERLRQMEGTLSVEQLALQTGQHANTVREHLEALTGDGYATKTAGPKEGRGRPAWLYQATAAPAAPVGYLALAAALAQHLASTSTNPAAAGESAGRSWARALPGTSRLGTVAAEDVPGKAGGKIARQRVATALDQAGFGIQGNRDATELTLTTCPLVEVAKGNPEVVCAVHLGLVKELLSGSGLPEGDVLLLPFAGPGFCTLHLPGSVTPS